MKQIISIYIIVISRSFFFSFFFLFSPHLTSFTSHLKRPPSLYLSLPFSPTVLIGYHPIPSQMPLRPFSGSVVSLKKALLSRGLDICVPFLPSASHVLSSAVRIPDEAYTAVLVGNTKAIWEPFVEWYKKEKSLRRDCETEEKRERSSNAGLDHLSPSISLPSFEEHPFSRYVCTSLSESCSSAFPDDPSHVLDTVYSFEMTKGRLFSFQKLAQEVGLMYLNPTTHLCVHDKYGPWTALRAVILLRVEPSEWDIEMKGEYSNREKEHVSAESLSLSSTTLPLNPCEGSACKEVHDGLMSGIVERMMTGEIIPWKELVAARDVCEVGKEYRYTEKQILYHYVKDPTLLDGL